MTSVSNEPQYVHPRHNTYGLADPRERAGGAHISNPSIQVCDAPKNIRPSFSRARPKSWSEFTCRLNRSVELGASRMPSEV